MEELATLRRLVQKHDYEGALHLLDDMEEMGLKAIRNQVYSFIKVLLIHLMKQQAEKRTTRSWELSIENSLDQIHTANARNDAGSTYLSEGEIYELIDKAYHISLKNASIEAFEGVLSEREFAKKLNEEEIKQTTLSLILNYQP
jgi:hypothetical protein